MLKVTIIGHVGADAERASKDGKEFVRFRVATSRAYTKADGTSIEDTQWHSCIMSGVPAVTQYLVKGQLVFLEGYQRLSVYSSPKLKKMVAGSEIQVLNVQLLGGSTDTVPAELVAPDGRILAVSKAYFISQSDLATLSSPVLYGKRGGEFSVDRYGFIVPTAPAGQGGQGEASQNEISEGGSMQTTDVQAQQPVAETNVVNTPGDGTAPF